MWVALYFARKFAFLELKFWLFIFLKFRLCARNIFAVSLLGKSKSVHVKKERNFWVLSHFDGLVSEALKMLS